MPVSWGFATWSILLLAISGAIGILSPHFLISRSFKLPSLFVHVHTAHSFSVGVLLSTAFVHVLPAGQRMLSEGLPSIDFSLSGMFTLIAVLITLIAERASSTSSPLLPSTLSPHNHNQQQQQQQQQQQAHSKTTTMFLKGISKLKKISPLELGILLHSVILGMVLGIECASDESGKVHSLLLALCAHQLLEGLAVGASSQPSPPTWKSPSMLAFSFAAPVGVVIGLGLYNTLLGDAGVGRWSSVVSGSLESLAGGVLVSTTLLELLPNSPGRHATLATILGALLMSLIGLWV